MLAHGISCKVRKVREMKRPELSSRDKVALVRGAPGGLGGAIAWAFGLAGAKVFLHDILVEKLKERSPRP